MKIAKKIVGFAVNQPNDASATAATAGSDAGASAGASAGVASSALAGVVGGAAAGGQDSSPMADVIHMHETLERPHKLIGSTYKLKTPDHVSAHAMYITINDIVLNEGTEHELRRPFEVFINSKNLEHYQWIVALTLIMSAVFRKGGDITFLVDELRSVFDPRGGYWNKGKYMPSIIAEIGEVIERHLIDIGMLKGPELDEHQKALIEKKKAELRAETAGATGGDATGADSSGSNSTDNASAHAASDASSGANVTSMPVATSGDDAASASGDEAWMATATLCGKCSTKAVVLRDGCQTCMNCGDSKCG